MSDLKLVLVRHGESQWNKENRFTGWVDVDLSEKGRDEARQAGVLLKKEGYQFDEAHTSILKRAIRTLWTVQDETDQMWLPVYRSWRLNERHYGALQGLNKAETAAKYGEEQVFIWRRSYDITPPPMSAEQAQAQSQERRFQSVPRADLPTCEALLQCKNRVMPYWEQTLAPALKSGRRLLVVAHGNSLRALVKHLDQVPDDEISELNIPTGIPLVYELDSQLKAKKHYYLGDPEAAKKAAQAVAQQGKKQN